MEIGSIFLILALLLLVGLFVSRPFFNKNQARLFSAPDQSDHERSALLAERDRVLTALWELDFDYTLGKIPEEDYSPQRAALLHKGANLLRQLDALQPGEDAGVDAEARLEATIAARRVSTGAIVADGPAGLVAAPAVIAAQDDEFEVLLANRRRVRQEKAAGFCPQCGQPIQKSDRFCPKCGAKTA
jgi:hypothetical protein